MKKLILILLTAAILLSCKNNTQITKTDEKEIITFSEYRIIGSNYYRSIEKCTIENHEYIIFGSKLANPPTVVHNENCPCKNKQHE